MVDETHDAIAAALGDPEVRVLVLASALPRYFSAGADLQVFKGIGQDGMRRWAERCHDDRAPAARLRPSRCSPPSTAPRWAAGWR